MGNSQGSLKVRLGVSRLVSYLEERGWIYQENESYALFILSSEDSQLGIVWCYIKSGPSVKIFVHTRRTEVCPSMD